LADVAGRLTISISLKCLNRADFTSNGKVIANSSSGSGRGCVVKHVFSSTDSSFDVNLLDVSLTLEVVSMDLGVNGVKSQLRKLILTATGSHASLMRVSWSLSASLFRIEAFNINSFVLRTHGVLLISNLERR
jgi:hypothetical protein